MVETVGVLLLEAGSLLFTGGAAAGTAIASTAVVGSVTIGAIVGSAALVGGSLALSSLLAPGQAPADVPRPSDAGSQTMQQAIPPRVFGYGRARTAGAYVFYEATEAGDSYDVIALHHGEIQEILYVYLNDDLVVLDGSGYVSSVVGVEPTDLRYSSSVVQIKFRYGEPTESHYAEVAAAFPTYWSVNHRGDGQASALLICTEKTAANFWKRMPHGLPKLSVVADLTAITDYRSLSSSASRNPVLQVIDLLTSADHGFGLDYDTLIAPVLGELMIEADICDEIVPLASGATEQRYASSGIAYLTTDPVEILKAILDACDGWMAEGPNGAIQLWVGQYREPSIVLGDDDIIGFSIDHGLADEDAVNELRITYTPRGNDYREALGEAWQDEADIAERGRIRSQMLDLTWVQSHGQARRLAKRRMGRLLASRRGTLTCWISALRCQGQRWVRVRSETIPDLADAVLEVGKMRIDLARAQVSFDWVLVNPNAIDAWDPATEEGVEPVYPSKIAVLDLPVVTGLAAILTGGGYDVTFDDPQRPDLLFTIQWRVQTIEAAYRRIDYASFDSDGSTVTLRIAPVPPADIPGWPVYAWTDSHHTIDIEVATRDGNGNLSTWSVLTFEQAF